jgi:hypothetical protein
MWRLLARMQIIACPEINLPRTNTLAFEETLGPSAIKIFAVTLQITLQFVRR